MTPGGSCRRDAEVACLIGNMALQPNGFGILLRGLPLSQVGGRRLEGRAGRPRKSRTILLTKVNGPARLAMTVGIRSMTLCPRGHEANRDALGFVA